MLRIAKAAWLVLALGIVTARASWAADEKPKATLRIVEPQEGSLLQGGVTVIAEAAPAEISPTNAYVSLGGPPHVAMKRVGRTGRWTAQVDTTASPNGDCDLMVVAHSAAVKRIQQTIKVKLGNPLRCYFGDIHSHTFYSDGSLIPAEAYAYARRTAKLDFYILTDHLELVDDREWADMREQAFKANEEGEFIALPGLEWTTKNGHACLLDPPGRIWPREVAELFQQGERATWIGMFNHPGDGAEVYGGLAYSEVGDRAFELMEVRDDKEQQAYIRALRNGWHIAAAGTDDTHWPNWGSGNAWTGILAPGLTRANVWHALKSRHCYSTRDRNCRLDFRLGGGVMGDELTEPLTAPKAVVVLEDPDRGDRIARAELFEDGEVVQSIEPQTERVRWESAPLTTPGKHVYFVKVTQADRQVLWSAPVWVEIRG